MQLSPEGPNTAHTPIDGGTPDPLAGGTGETGLDPRMGYRLSHEDQSTLYGMPDPMLRNLFTAGGNVQDPYFRPYADGLITSNLEGLSHPQVAESLRVLGAACGFGSAVSRGVAENAQQMLLQTIGSEDLNFRRQVGDILEGLRGGQEAVSFETVERSITGIVDGFSRGGADKRIAQIGLAVALGASYKGLERGTGLKYYAATQLTASLSEPTDR